MKRNETLQFINDFNYRLRLEAKPETVKVKILDITRVDRYRLQEQLLQQNAIRL